MSIKTVCDRCGKELKALSARPRKENNTGVEISQGKQKKHVCSECITSLLNETK